MVNVGSVVELFFGEVLINKWENDCTIIL